MKKAFIVAADDCFTVCHAWPVQAGEMNMKTALLKWRHRTN